MKFSALQIFSILASTVLGQEANSDVVELTAADFDKHIKSHNLVLAEFFAPWCGHCKNLAPEYEEAASELKNKTDNISLVKVDCVVNNDLCQKHNVRGFPTLYVFENGENTGQYQGSRKAKDIANFMVKRSLPPVTDVKNSAGVEEWLSSNMEPEDVAILYLGPSKSYDEFVKVATKKRETLAFISASDADLKKKYNDSDIVLFIDAESEPAATLPAGTALNEENIFNFVKANEFRPFTELGPHNYAAYIDNGSPLLFAFAEDDEQRALLKQAISPHLDLLNGKANVVFLDAAAYGSHATSVGLEEKFPAICVHDIASNKKYSHSQDSALTEKSIAEFIKKYTAGELQPFVKTEPVPETQDGPVYVLVGSEYDDVVLDNDKDVLVEFYAPWCGHCKNLKPIYEELGEYYQDNDNIVIAKLDHTLNEVPDEIQGYPTIKLFPAGKKDSPVQFESERSLKKLINFIESKGVAVKKGTNGKAAAAKPAETAKAPKVSKDPKPAKGEL